MKFIAFCLVMAAALASGAIVALFAILMANGGQWPDRRTADEKFGCTYEQTDIASGECK